MEIRFTVDGKVQPKQRVRVTRSGHAYTPRQTVKYERHVVNCYNEEYELVKLNGEIHAEITAVYPIPKNTPKARRELMLLGNINPTIKPDCDNVAKAIMDALNGVAYDDDKQVTKLTVNKIYGDEPCAVVRLREAK